MSRHSLSNVYSVPDNYFEGLAAQIMGRIKALESGIEESSLLGSISKKMPNQLPAGYFDGLENKLMQSVLQSEKQQTASEELESLSPLLSNLNKKMPYSVPAGYFENFNVPANDITKQETKVVSLTSRKWFRYAAAAVVTGFVALSGFLIFGNNNKGTTDPGDIVKTTVETVGEDDITNFIELTAEEAPVIAMASTSAEVMDLVKNISDQELEDFEKDLLLN